MAILINDVSPVASYDAAEGQTAFPYTFAIFDEEDMIVLRNGVQATYNPSPASVAEYSVSGIETEDGGTVTFGGPTSLGDRVVLYRDIPVERTANYPTTGPFMVESLNVEQAKQIAIIQQLERDIGRSIRMPIGDDGYVLPDAEERADKILGFDSNGDGQVLDPSLVKGDPGSAGRAYSTVAALAAAGDSATNFDDAALSAAGREGIFYFTTADMSAEVAADTYNGIYVARAGDPTGATGTWVRDHGGLIYLENFGVLTDSIDHNTPATVLARVDHNRPRLRAMCSTLALIPQHKIIRTLGPRVVYDESIPFLRFDNYSCESVEFYCANTSAGAVAGGLGARGSILVSNYGAPDNQSAFVEPDYDLSPVAVNDKDVTFVVPAEAAKYEVGDIFLAVAEGTYLKGANTRWQKPWWGLVEAVSGATLTIDKPCPWALTGTPRALHINSGEATHPVQLDDSGAPEPMRLSRSFRFSKCRFYQAQIDETTGAAILQGGSGPLGSGGAYDATVEDCVSLCYLGLLYGNMWVNSNFRGNVAGCSQGTTDYGYLSYNTVATGNRMFHRTGPVEAADPAQTYLNEGSAFVTLLDNIYDWRGGGDIGNLISIAGGARFMTVRGTYIMDAGATGFSLINAADSSLEFANENIDVDVRVVGAASFGRVGRLIGAVGTDAIERNNRFKVYAPEITSTGEFDPFLDVSRMNKTVFDVRIPDTIVENAVIALTDVFELRGEAEGLSVTVSGATDFQIYGKFIYSFPLVAGYTGEVENALVKTYRGQAEANDFVIASGADTAVANNGYVNAVASSLAAKLGGGFSGTMVVSGPATGAPTIYGEARFFLSGDLSANPIIVSNFATGGAFSVNAGNGIVRWQNTSGATVDEIRWTIKP